MLSKTERDYLLGTYTPSITHKRVLNHRIKNKIKEYYSKELPLIQNVTEFSNAVTEFSNTTNNNILNVKHNQRAVPQINKWIRV